MKAFVILIDWYGPYTRGELADAAFSGNYWRAIYLARGRRSIKQELSLRYIGISQTNFPYRVWEPHPQLDQIEEIAGAEMWGGLVTYHQAPDISSANTSQKYAATVNWAETILVFLLQPDLNIRKRDVVPSEPAIIINRWFSGSDLLTKCARPDAVVADFIEYDPELGATKAWHDQSPRVERLTVAEIQSLAAGRKTS